MTAFKANGTPIVPTRGMESGLTNLAAAIEAEYGGMGLHSLTRFGKTTLAEYIEACHGWLDTPYVATLARLRDLKSGQGAFYDWFTARLGLQPITQQAPEQKLLRIVNTVTLKTQASKAKLFLFIMDDANLLEAESFQYFIDIDNALEEGGQRFFLLSLFQDNHTVGRREKINKLIVTPQVRSRFLTRYHALHGLRGIADLHTYHQRFEDEVETAPGSGVTLPRLMAPSLYDSGWRMCESAQLIWETGQQYRAAAGKQVDGEWPLKAFSLIANFLAQRTICKPMFSTITASDIELAVQFSDLAAYDGESGEVDFSDDDD